MVEEWTQGAGVVFWAGHGINTKVSRTLWPEDVDSDGVADDGEIQSVDMTRAFDASRIGTNRPAFVMPVSCEVGSVESPGTLTYELLLHNAAIGVLSFTNVTPAGSFGWDLPTLEFPTETPVGTTSGYSLWTLCWRVSTLERPLMMRRWRWALRGRSSPW